MTIDPSRFLITASAPFIISSMMLAALISRLVWPTDSPASRLMRLTREAQALHEEIKQKNTDGREMIEKMFAERSNVKTDRTLLASLFVEVAKCLNQDLASKAGKSGGAPSRCAGSAGKIMP
jgi:hypothetical protein